MHSRDDLVVLKGLDVMRRRPEMYLPRGINAADIASLLVGDALLLGAKHVRVDVVAGWYVVSSALDWLMAQSKRVVPVPKLFQGLIVFPEGGQNAVRAEAWVGAYSRAGYAVTPIEQLCVVGSEPLPEDVRMACCPDSCIRSVAFVLNDS